MLTGWFGWFIVSWTVILLGLMSIGGFFMFRKFLKRLPMADGKSILDWQEHFMERSKHMWRDDEKKLLESLVEPVPELFRDIARLKIASTIGKIAIEEGSQHIEQDHIIRGYIVASPKRDHKFLRKALKREKIDLQPYERFFAEA